MSTFLLGPVASANTLQQVLDTGNTATGVNATITLTDTDVGGQANPMLTMTNTNATGSVALEVYKNKPTAGVAGDVLYNQSVYGKDSGNAKQEYTRVSHTLRDSAAGVEDGSIEFGCFVNGAMATFLQINGNENEINATKPIDMVGNNIRSSVGSMTITTTLSAGLGNITTAAKGDTTTTCVNATTTATQNLALTGTNDVSISSTQGCAVQSVLGAGPLGALYTNPGIVELQADTQLNLTGAALQTISAGIASIQFLRINLNGTFYKIALLNDV